MLRLLDLWRWRRRQPGSRRSPSSVRPAVPAVSRSPGDANQPGSHRRVSRYRLLRRPRVSGGRAQSGDVTGGAADQLEGGRRSQPSGQWQRRSAGADPRPPLGPHPGSWPWPGSSSAPRQARWPGEIAGGRTSWPATDPRTDPADGLAAPAPGWQTQGSQELPARGHGRAAVRAATKAQAAADKTAARRRSVALQKTAAQQKTRARETSTVPWYERAQRTRSAPGQRHCGLLEKILHRQWKAEELPPPQIVLAVDRLAEFPQLIKERLVAGLDAIYLGPGGVPDLDDMSGLSGMPLPSGRATWDSCAGAYGDRKVIVGSRPSPTPDVMCHEIGHALDDIDGPEGAWQSDSAEFTALYGQCQPWMTSDFHRHSSALGRREFFADAFAAIASSQRPALVEMLDGNTREALGVMLYFNVRYGI